MKLPHFTAGRLQSGLTLIELMISLAIGLVVLGSLLVVYLGSRAAYRTSDNLARVQESGRFAMEFIAQDARMSGFFGCHGRNLSEGIVANITRNPKVHFRGALDGVIAYEDPDSDDDAVNADFDRIGSEGADPKTVQAMKDYYLRGDIIAFRHVVGTPVGILERSGEEKVKLIHNAIGLKSGDLAVLADCTRAMVFRVTNNPAPTSVCYVPDACPTDVEFKETGNDKAGVFFDVDFSYADPDKPTDEELVRPRPQVARMDETWYFIGHRAGSQPSLLRVRSRAPLEPEVEELIDNVENMDIVYGVDTTPNPDGVIDVYQRADQVTDWSRVLAARISLLVVGPEDNITSGRQRYSFGETGGIEGKDSDGLPNIREAGDQRLRQVFTTTVSLRNRVD